MIKFHLSHVEKTPVLSQIFEPIRADLEAVDREFGRQVESQVAIIPTMGKYIQQGGGNVDASWEQNLTAADVLVVPKGSKNKRKP